jgi:hypothetical protein
VSPFIYHIAALKAEYNQREKETIDDRFTKKDDGGSAAGRLFPENAEELR